MGDPLYPKEGNIEVYQARPRPIQVGDKLRFRRNDKSLGIINAEAVNVIAINDKQVSLDRINGDSLNLSIDASALKHIDYAYTNTDYSVQGLDKEAVVALVESHSPLLNKQSQAT